jgi:hypothetical protein
MAEKGMSHFIWPKTTNFVVPGLTCRLPHRSEFVAQIIKSREEIEPLCDNTIEEKVSDFSYPGRSTWGADWNYFHFSAAFLGTSKSLQITFKL